MNLLISFSGTGRIPDQLVILDMKHGVEAKNYEEVCAALVAGEAVATLLCEISLQATACALPWRLGFSSVT